MGIPGYAGNIPTIGSITDLYSALTGIEITPAQLMKAAERSWSVSKHLKVRAGFGKRDDQLPGIWFKPLIREERTRPERTGASVPGGEMVRLLFPIGHS